MKKQSITLALLALVILSSLVAHSAHARGDVDVEDNELGPAEQHYTLAKKAFYAKVNALAKSGDEYDRRRAQMLLKEMPGVISASESVAAKKCDTVSRLIGNGSRSNMADFRCQIDEMKQTEGYLSRVIDTFKNLEYTQDQGCTAGQTFSDQEESHDRSAE